MLTNLLNEVKQLEFDLEHGHHDLHREGFQDLFFLRGQFEVFHEGYHDTHYYINQTPSLITGIKANK
jgi:hypothetical protein